MIARPDVFRGKRGNWVANATLYSTAAIGVAAASGFALGLLGSAIDAAFRTSAAAVLAGVGAVLGSALLAGARLRPLQCDRETPQRWMQHGARVAAIKNGLALGNGATTRIGFWSWYLIPVSALLLGDPLLGAIVYGTYGAVRALSAWGWIAFSIRATNNGDDASAIPLRVFRCAHAAGYVSAAQLAGIAMITLIAVGL